MNLRATRNAPEGKLQVEPEPSSLPLYPSRESSQQALRRCSSCWLPTACGFDAYGSRGPWCRAAPRALAQEAASRFDVRILKRCSCPCVNNPLDVVSRDVSGSKCTFAPKCHPAPTCRGRTALRVRTRDGMHA